MNARLILAFSSLFINVYRMVVRGKRGEAATIATVLVAFVLLSVSVLIVYDGGITGFASLSLSNISSYDESIVLEFYEAGSKTIYLDLANHDYTKAEISITGDSILNPQVDILDNGIVDWNYAGSFSSSEVIDFLTAMKIYLLNCGGYPCNVPITVSVESAGNVVLDELVLEYTERNETGEVIEEPVVEIQSSGKVEQEVIDELETEEEVRVIVKLKDEIETGMLGITGTAVRKFPKQARERIKNLKGIKRKRAEKLELVKQRVKAKQDIVLSKLDVEDLRQKGFRAARISDFKLKHKYSTINAFSGTVTNQGLAKLQADPDVESVQLDRKVQISLSDSVHLINADDAWNEVVNGINITGAGQTICIIDTGVDYTHADLGGCFGAGCKIIGGYDIVNSDNNPMDDHGHGTHVAGIAAADGSIKGVAPDSNLIAIKSLDSNGDGYISDIDAGIDWCINNASKFNISVISMSLGTKTYHNANYCDEDFLTTSAAINNAVDLGIIVMIASGNEAQSNGISAPACVANATSVGATDKNDNIASYTNLAPILDLLAPGSDIASTCLGGGSCVKSGTSMATPHAAGAAALVIQKKQESGEEVIPSEIESTLENNGINVSGYDRIDVLQALEIINTDIVEQEVIDKIDAEDEAWVGIILKEGGSIGGQSTEQTKEERLETIKTNVKTVQNRVLSRLRSEERRVGKECRSRWSPYH